MNLDAATTGELPASALRTVPDRWILSRLDATLQQVNSSLATYDMDDASRALYTFFWDDFCDWYVEMAKPRLRGTDEEKSVAQNMLAFVLETTLRLLHPLIPFITEEIWQALPHQGESLCLAPYPTETSSWFDAEAEAAMSLTIATTRAIRNMKMEMNIPPGTRLTAAALPGDTAAQSSLTANAELIASLARLEVLNVATTAPGPETGKWIATPVIGAEIYLEIGDALDIGKETERIEKELAAVLKQIERSQNQLNNPNFVQRAAPERVAEERQRLTEWEAKKTSLEERKRLFTA
jgi:valyl-tRNA synthetase